MKTLLALLLLIPVLARADTQTTGNMKLLLPTTGQAFDPNDSTKRPWGAKINENFRIIDSSFTVSQSNLDALNSTVTAISASTSTLGTSLSQRTIVVSDEGGSGAATVSKIDCVGGDFACTQVGSTVTVTHTPSAAGGGVGGNSTATVTIAGGGAVYQSTTIPALGTIFTIGKSTWHVIDVRGYTTFVSTVARASFQVAVTTSLDYGTPWQLRSPQIHVSTGNKFSIWYTTAFPLHADDAFGLFIQTVAPSGIQAAEWGVTMRYWKEPEPYP